MKTAPPTGLGSRSCKGLAVIWTRKVEFFVCGAHPKLGRKSDWILVKVFFFFWDLLTSAGKTVSILVQTFLGGRSPDLDRKTASIWFKTDENLGQVCLLLFSPLQKATRFAKSWLRACFVPAFCKLRDVLLVSNVCVFRYFAFKFAKKQKLKKIDKTLFAGWSKI